MNKKILLTVLLACTVFDGGASHFWRKAAHGAEDVVNLDNEMHGRPPMFQNNNN